MAQKQMKPKDVHIIHLAKLVTGPHSILYKEADLLTYDCDGFTIERHLPRAVIFPKDTEEVSKIVKYCSQNNLPFIARGAGTGLSDGRFL